MATEIARLHAEAGIAYSDMAIMYRANAQSRSLEEALINTNQPYQLVGGTKFYERREIKDALAYLQALVNPDDDVNLRRILNVPSVGLATAPKACCSPTRASMAPASSTHSCTWMRSRCRHAPPPRYEHSAI